MGDYKQIHISTLLKYYKRAEIQQALVKAAENKEVAVSYGGTGYGRRPDILKYPKDVLEAVKTGATSFHCSEELWNNPLQITTGAKPEDLNNLRIGWDLILDIDCPELEYSKIAADLIVQALQHHGIENLGVKFSVSGDTPVLIKHKNSIKFVNIKNAINIFKAGNQLEVLSLNKRGNLAFSKVYDYLIHKEQLYELFHNQSGVPLKVTAHHSVIVWNDYQIIPKKVGDLNPGDCLISFNSSKKLKRKIPTIINKYTLHSKEYHRKFKTTKDFLRLIGYYLAEGHLADVNNQVGFSFNSNEKTYISDCKKIIRKLAGFNSALSERNPSLNATQVVFYSKEWYSFFKEYCGKGAKLKHLPDFCWLLPKNYFLELLRGYLRGDGHIEKDRYVTAKSVSTRLASEIVWLCKLNGISCNLYKEKNKSHQSPQGNFFKDSFVFMIKIPRRDIPLGEFSKRRKKYAKMSHDKVYPTDGLRFVYEQLKPKKFISHRNEQMALKKRFANKKIIKKIIKWFEETASAPETNDTKSIINRYLKIIDSDVCFLPISKIRRINKDIVYDISVEATENFFGNFYPLLLHNSGNHGFHIGVPYEAFPETVNGKPIKDSFPDGPRKIAMYLQAMIKEPLAQRLLQDTPNKIAEKVRKTVSEIVKNGQLEPFSVLSIDTILIATRHLYRMPYSLNEKSGLVSVVIKPEEILSFDKKDATPEKVMPKLIYLDRTKTIPGEARKLIVNAFDYKTSQETPQELKELVEKKEYEPITEAVPEQYFPPCIQLISQGLKDGRKRALFVLINFLTSIGWSYEMTEKYLAEWNKKNGEPLREVLVQGQLRYHKMMKKKVLPPNCDNKAYMADLGVCKPDNFCPKVKNPVNYAVAKQRMSARNKPTKQQIAL